MQTHSIASLPLSSSHRVIAERRRLAAELAALETASPTPSTELLLALTRACWMENERALRGIVRAEPAARLS